MIDLDELGFLVGSLGAGSPEQVLFDANYRQLKEDAYEIGPKVGDEESGQKVVDLKRRELWSLVVKLVKPLS